MIILVVGILVQTVPVTRGQDCEGITHNNNKSAKASKLEHLYCAVRSLRRTTQQLNSTITDQLSGIDINTNTVPILIEVFEKFSNTCKKFTTAMSLKHQLQQYMLSDSGPVLNSSQVKFYSSMLVSLQTITNILDDIEFIQHKRHCVTLTSAHYEKIYYQNFDNTSLLDVMIKELASWLNSFGKSVIANSIMCICKTVYENI